MKNGFYETGWFFTHNDTELIITSSTSHFDKGLIDDFTDFIRTAFPDVAEKPVLYQRA